MAIRTVFAILAVAAGAYAQPAGPPQGRNGFGPGFAGESQDARLLGAVAGVPRRVVRNAPYSATTVTETTQVLADGNRIHHPSTGKIFRDSEGRVRNEQSMAGLDALAPHASIQQVVFINDPVAGVNYALNVHDKTATKSWGRWNMPATLPMSAATASAPPTAIMTNPSPPAGGMRQRVRADALGAVRTTRARM